MIQNAPIVTHLKGELKGASVHRDVNIEFVPFEPTRNILYSKRAAIDLSANAAMIPGVAAALILYMIPRFRRRLLRLFCGVSFAVLLIFVLSYSLLPKTNAKLTRIDYRSLKFAHQNQIVALKQVMNNTREQEGMGKLSIEQIRSLFKEYVEEQGEGDERSFWSPPLSPEWKEEDSPGNYLVRLRDDILEYVWFDGDGGENVIVLHPEP